MTTFTTPTNKNIVVYFWRHMMRYPLKTFAMVATAPLALLFNEFLPALIVSGILDRLAHGQFRHGDVWGSFGPQVLLAIGLSAIGGTGLWRINAYFNWSLEGKVGRNISTEVFDHLMKMSAAFHANSFGGSLVSQANKLTSAYVRLTDTTLYSTGNLFWSLVFSNVMLLGRAPLFVVLLDTISVAFVIVSFVVTKEVRQQSAVHADAENDQTAQLADSITNVMAVKSFAGEQREHKRYYQVSEKERTTLMRLMQVTMKSQATFSLTSIALYSIAVIIAVTSVVSYNANMATVFLVLAFTADIKNRLWEFGNSALRNYNRAFGDAQAMIKILALPAGVKDPVQPEVAHITKGSISFQNVNFGHDEANKQNALFEHLNLEVRSGEKIGLVGHSGSGKTTLTKLLLRFNDLDSGQIAIDGQNIAKIRQTDLRQSIAYVPQEPLLFHRSIHDNIAYGKPDASSQEVKVAARHAHAAEFIETLPQGYKTLVGERGVKLSGGQRQRIAIARAMLKNAPLLVLDEATSALDSESEALIQDALWQLMQGRTTIVIAHRLSTIQRMDRIVVLDKGKIAEQGNHNDLIKQGGIYAKLWAHQSGGFLED